MLVTNILAVFGLFFFLTSACKRLKQNVHPGSVKEKDVKAVHSHREDNFCVISLYSLSCRTGLGAGIPEHLTAARFTVFAPRSVI